MVAPASSVGTEALASLTKSWPVPSGAGPEDLRYERKFLTGNLSPQEIEQLVRWHPCLFREIFRSRQVNNVYLDTPDLDHYWENVRGDARRMKARLRWYGPTLHEVREPRLEFKTRNGSVGRKWTFHPTATPAVLESMLEWAGNGWHQSGLPDVVVDLVRTLSPSLVNCYQRKYFLSADGTVRLTIDSALEYFGVQGHRYSPCDRVQDHYSTILELKYDPTHDDGIHAVSSFFPFRVTRSSKYVMGLEALRG